MGDRCDKRKTKQTNLFLFLKKQKPNSESSTVACPVPSSSTTNVDSSMETEKHDDLLHQDVTATENAGHFLDIGNYVISRDLSDAIKYKIIKECWEPPPDYKFPVFEHKNHKRKFQRNWLQQYPWLAYSGINEGTFCKPCVLFGRTKVSEYGDVPLSGLVKTAFTKYKNALEYFRSHENNQYHVANVLYMKNFSKIHENKMADVSVQLQSALQVEIENNRKKLIPIIKTVIFCGQQNIPLRGHRDDGILSMTPENDCDRNEGNFRNLLRFRVDAGDIDLRNHLNTAPKNATYVSKTIQNDIIECCGDIIQAKIVEKVKRNKYFSILVDETTDVSVKEQMSLCLRYYDRDQYIVREDFLAFIEVTSCTGQALFRTVKNHLELLGLDIKNIRGQGYDGAANMSGNKEGLQAYISREQPLALYTHCYSHCLNLVLCKACSIPVIRNTIGKLKECTNFIRDSALRMNEFIGKLKEAEQRYHPLKKIKKMCETRWVEKHEAIIDFLEMLPTLIDFLVETEQNGNSASSSKASTLLAAVTTSEFLVSLFVIGDLIKFLIPLSTQLQSVQLDISKACEICNLALKALEEVRSDSDNHFNLVFNKVFSTAQVLNIDIKIPRTTKKQTNRSNYESANIEQYYRLSIFLPFLDYLISELQSRFSEKQSHIAELWNIVPTYLDKLNHEKFLAAIKFYQDDISCITTLEGEMKLWKIYWDQKTEKPTNLIDTIIKTDLYFPNIKQLLQILVTIPVTSCTPERSFSSLRLLKSYLQSTMAASRLNGLALLYIHKNKIDVSPEEVSDQFSKKHKRRLQLRNMLSSD